MLVVCVLCVLACNGQFTSFAGFFFLIWWSWKDIVRSNSNLLNVNVCVLFACTQRVFVNACCARTRTSDIKPLVHLFTWILYSYRKRPYRLASVISGILCVCCIFSFLNIRLVEWILDLRISLDRAFCGIDFYKLIQATTVFHVFCFLIHIMGDAGIFSRLQNSLEFL